MRVCPNLAARPRGGFCRLWLALRQALLRRARLAPLWPRADDQEQPWHGRHRIREIYFDPGGLCVAGPMPPDVQCLRAASQCDRVAFSDLQVASIGHLVSEQAASVCSRISESVLDAKNQLAELDAGPMPSDESEAVCELAVSSGSVSGDHSGVSSVGADHVLDGATKRIEAEVLKSQQEILDCLRSSMTATLEAFSARADSPFTLR
mmetsp:Transcript_4882/g.12250  ORF Transcript_4882/g.12250 Transcript_4882/m.12250 type:complete len:207 (+) Transcript_4882:594-1214(+)